MADYYTVVGEALVADTAEHFDFGEHFDYVFIWNEGGVPVYVLPEGDANSPAIVANTNNDHIRVDNGSLKLWQLPGRMRKISIICTGGAGSFDVYACKKREDYGFPPMAAR